MNRRNILIGLSAVCFSMSANAQQVHKGLQKTLEPVYDYWRSAMVQKNYRAWKAVTSNNQQMTIYNRVVSEKKPYPGTVFALPVSPPSLKGLKAINVNMKGASAVATYFGPIDFGIGGKPSKNLMLLHFVGENRAWKFDRAEYINLSALPEVRKQMQAGNYSYAGHADFTATGVVPKTPKKVVKPGYIAKVYVYSPGREVKVDVNSGRSLHRFQNDKRAEVLIGGAKFGLNTIKFSTKLLSGATGKEPLDIRVFLMSQVKGVKPISVYQYRLTPAQIASGKTAKTSEISNFRVTTATAKAILNKK